MKDYLKRDLYIDKVIPFIGKPIIKVFTGQRRVGKSYFMYQVIDEIKKINSNCNIIYIDKEKNKYDKICNYNDLLQYIRENKFGGKNAVFIDEIQEIEGFEKALRDLYTLPEFDLYCTGSNANMLSGELSTMLSGRYVEIEIHALSFPEFLRFHQLENNNKSLDMYFQHGGLPNLIHLDTDHDIVYDYLKNIYTTILYNDIIRRHNIRNVVFLENLIEFVADNLGSIVSSKKISEFLKSQNIKMAPNTIIDYLSYLCNAFFIYKIQRKNAVGKKIFEIGEKYYFEDLGLRNSIIGYKINDISKIIENAIFIHLKILGFSIKIGVINNFEVDFIAEKAGEKIYVQACYLLREEKTIEREFGNLLLIKDNYPKYVVSMDELSGFNTYKGIIHLHVREFLSNYNL